jgi:Glycosyl transferase family 2
LIKLIGIAKDEGAYIGEWVVYHFGIGVDEIEIYANDCSDNTVEVLRFLQARYPGKLKYSYFSRDDLRYEPQAGVTLDAGYLQRNPVQSISYANSFESLRGKFEYACYLDIDEYLYSEKHSDVQAMLHQHKAANHLQLYWLNINGEAEEFATVPEACAAGVFINEYKSICRLGETLTIVDSHLIHSQTPVTSNGRPYVHASARLGVIDGKFDNYVIHRNKRSMVEYKSLIVRGDTIDNSANGLKMNRDGWYQSSNHQIVYNERFLAPYREDMAKLLLDQEYLVLLADAVNYKRQMAESLQEKIDQLASSQELQGQFRRWVEALLAGTDVVLAPENNSQ